MFRRKYYRRLGRRRTGWSSSLRWGHLCRGDIWAAIKDPNGEIWEELAFQTEGEVDAKAKSKASLMSLRMESIQWSWRTVRWRDEVRAHRPWSRYLISHDVCSRISDFSVFKSHPIHDLFLKYHSEHQAENKFGRGATMKMEISHWSYFSGPSGKGWGRGLGWWWYWRQVEGLGLSFLSMAIRNCL